MSTYILTLLSMIDLMKYKLGIYVLAENGQNVFLKDCIAFGIGSQTRKFIERILKETVLCIQNRMGFDRLIKANLLKRLDRQSKAKKYDLWEIREPGGSRLIFMLQDPDTIILSAVHKGRGNLSNAVNRGVNRWLNYQKTLKQLTLMNS